MRNDRFEWDDAKAAVNFLKHDVSFSIATEAFDDPVSTEEPEPDPDEDRWRLTGMTRYGLLVMIFTERFYVGADDEEHMRMRIISARKANTHEQILYQRQATSRR